MSFWQQYKSPLGYSNNNNNQIDSYGVDHSSFSTQDELQYQNARINREKNLMTQMNNQGITTYPQYTTNFWGIILITTTASELLIFQVILRI